MQVELKRVLERLRSLLGKRTEQAYAERDERGRSSQARDFAAGEAHAYGVAEMDVREAERRDEA